MINSIDIDLKAEASVGEWIAGGFTHHRFCDRQVRYTFYRASE